MLLWGSGRDKLFLCQRTRPGSESVAMSRSSEEFQASGSTFGLHGVGETRGPRERVCAHVYMPEGETCAHVQDPTLTFGVRASVQKRTQQYSSAEAT